MLQRIDPLRFGRVCWPDVTFYLQQQQIVRSVDDNKETYVPAANMMGKDFVTAFIIVTWFLRAMKLGKTCRIVTTSVSAEHLQVLWGEISKFLATAKIPLVYHRRLNPNAPLVVNYQNIRRATDVKRFGYDDPNAPNYIVSRVVSSGGEGMSGHHSDCSLWVADEASGVPDLSYENAQGWFKRMLAIGNCNTSGNWFQRNVEAGNVVKQPLEGLVA